MPTALTMEVVKVIPVHVPLQACKELWVFTDKQALDKVRFDTFMADCRAIERPVEQLEAAAAVEVVLLEDFVEVDEAAALVTAGALGTVNGGAPAVFVPLEPDVPQAATPMEITATAASAAGRGLRKGRCIRCVVRTLRSPVAPYACRNGGSR